MGRGQFVSDDIESLIDGELDEETAVRLMNHLERDEKARAFFDKMTRQKTLLQLWWKDQKDH